MANPDAYDEKYSKWNMADLPIIPSDYKYEVAKATTLDTRRNCLRTRWI